MQVIYERCCGLDVHKRTITSCVLKWLGGGWQKEIRQFGTTTKDLLALSDWPADVKELLFVSAKTCNDGAVW